MKSLLFITSSILLIWSPTSSEYTRELNKGNVETTLASNDIVFVNFYANWCRFSQMLKPIFEEAAQVVQQEFITEGQVVLAAVDCDREPEVSQKYHISKYPTLKLFRNGRLAKREYRGQRSKDAFVQFIREQLVDPVVQLPNPAEIPKLNTSGDEDMLFMGTLGNFELLHTWSLDKCVPLVREITFENGEELTEEGIPFLILFHHPDDVDTVRQYNEIISRELMQEKGNVNFLTADGTKFTHPLHHLNKSPKDLPLIAIDSFRHMYLFPDMSKLTEPRRLLQFVQDLHNGKLHREFHHGPDPVTQLSVDGGGAANVQSKEGPRR
ncbi:putative endoplasmic reticulum resident protein 44 [Apostichopus japonicus]|uniref:Putative endoplasmic reticulum resident protein 44 n=1 Tax=Stichopus japonicus TaxID=307972 RepID=A0A2G8K739_STIJA|nr:putative endoplasmic reticulum resident protein 44 [Apostichopus japonicus]